MTGAKLTLHPETRTILESNVHNGCEIFQKSPVACAIPILTAVAHTVFVSASRFHEVDAERPVCPTLPQDLFPCEQ